ncbi:LapA family protein [Novosphingobium lentum]|uniref:LapA family protein n=1 Tax=Novosphingobium lentum TaxID=145287 RepID=UPI00082F4532|nr:LapA family protein [Novosphingobium lentum]
MQVVRTIVWVLVAVVLAAFTLANWQPVTVHIWQGLVLETKLPALVIGAFGLGLLPSWLLYRTTRWRLGRRIMSLENSLLSRTPAPPLGTTTQFDAATPGNPAA